ncbi:MAG: carboxypeptidase regulatory-like domain-containing protein, partial [Acidobacteriota bacterium]|nr:carboxypeptidase regulatory-like domain-containing protein [Acidobacteriota bacterium]
HHALHEWIAQDPNEANVFENGFLNQFKAAQANLKINAQNGMPGTFAYNGFSGQQPLPIFEAAFASEETSPYAAADYSNGTYINYLNQGRAGSMAGTLDTIFGNAPYYCNLVGASFGPCANTIGYTGAGAGYPINVFQANPYMSGQGTGLMNDTGYGNFNALQIELRQNNWHGMQFDANYQWAHGLGIEPNNNWTGDTALFTLRDPRLNYGPTLFDIRQSFHISGTYDLPFGNGKRFLNSDNPVLNRVVGGWTIGTIITYQTGQPFQVNGGYATFNDHADGGVLFQGVTNSQLQSAVGVYHTTNTYANGITPQYLNTNGRAANPQYLLPNTTPGAIGYHTWLYGPHFSNTDVAITKTTPIRENLRFVFQGEFLNAFNHPNWLIGNGNIRSSSFLHANVINNNTVGARQIQLRASIEF